MDPNPILTPGFARALGLLTEGVCVADSKGTVLFANEPFFDALGYRQEDLEGRSIGLVLERNQGPARLTDSARESGGAWGGDLLLKRKDGTVLAAAVTVVLLPDGTGGDPGMALLVRDVDGDSRLEAALSSISCVDPLTGLPDRAYFEVVLENEWRRSSRASLPLSMLLVGIDGFDECLAASGRRAADALVREVAGSLSGSARRAGELTARWDTSVFAVLLPGTEVPDARQFCAKLRRSAKALTFPQPGGTLTLSIGIAFARPSRSLPWSVLVDASAAALSEAVASGGNRVAEAGHE